MRPTHISALALAVFLAAPALAQNAPEGGKPPANAGQQAQAGGGQQGGADIQVQQPAPQVTVQQPAPDITVQQPKPQVTIQQPPPEVTVQQPKPDVTVQQAKPEVTVEQQGQPDVQVVQPGQQAQPGAGGQQGQSGDSGGAQDPLHALRGEQIVGRTVYGSNGEQIGDVDDVVIGRQGGGPAAVVGVGGFLGLGEHNVAIPLDQLRLDEGERLTTEMTREQIGSMPGYDASAYEAMDRGRTFGEAIGG